MSQRQLLGARLWLTAWNRSLSHSVFSFPCCLVFPGVTVLSEERCHLTTCPKWDSCRPVLFASQAELALSPACGSSRQPRRPQSSPPGTHFRGTRRFPVGLLRCPALASVLVTGNPRVWTTSALAPGDTALLSVTFPDPPIAALPSLSLVVISWPQSAFELMIEPRSAKSLMVSAPSWPPFKPCLSSVVMMFVSLGCRGGPALAPRCAWHGICPAPTSVGLRGTCPWVERPDKSAPVCTSRAPQQQQGRFPALAAAGGACAADPARGRIGREHRAVTGVATDGSRRASRDFLVMVNLKIFVVFPLITRTPPPSLQ